MNLIVWLSIACISYLPRQYPESLRQPPDTSQTPSRHPTDTPTTACFLPIQDNQETSYQLIEISPLGVYQLLANHAPRTVSRVTQTTPRHLPDTFQTPYKHREYGTFFTNPRQLGDEKPANIDQSIGCLSIACTSYPTDSNQSHSDSPQTPLRHFPDNLQTFRERRNQLIKITLIGFMSINITLYPQPILIDLGLSGICRRVSG